MASTADDRGAGPALNMGYVWAISLAAALGGLMFGYDWIVIGGTKLFYERFFALSTAWEEGWAMASALVGCLIGAVVSGMLSDRFGRKRLLILAAVIFVVSSIATGLAASFSVFNLWRIAGGIAIGLASNLSPMYIAEIAPAAVRGRLVSMNQFTIVIGILLAQGANFGIAEWGSAADRARVAEWPGEPLQAAPVAEELARQVPLDQRAAVADAFLARAATEGEGLDYAMVERIVEEVGRERGKPLKAERTSVELSGRGLASWNVLHGWRWMFGVTALPACLFFALLFFVPESPRWLAKNGQPEAARRVLARIGGARYADAELRAVEATLVGETQKVDFRELVEPRMLSILTLGITLAVLQQWCGINVIFYYAADLFRAAGSTVGDALLNIVIIGTVNLLATVVAVFSVDRLGRRSLLVAGFAGLTVTHTALAMSFWAGWTGGAVLAITLAAIGCYALTLAPVTWVVLSEIFPNRIRGGAMSVSVFALWTACFLLTFTFPLLNARLGTAGTFAIYAIICVFGLFFTLGRLAETKGKTLEEIEKELVG